MATGVAYTGVSLVGVVIWVVVFPPHPTTPPTTSIGSKKAKTRSEKFLPMLKFMVPPFGNLLVP
jgi:hypothetical protein